MKKILIIDDEPEMLESLKKILSRRKDFKLQLISDSSEAIQLVKNNKYDLIITDLKMKNVTGLDILKTATNHFPGSSVIMISGYGTIEASVEAMREGAFDFIEKPFTSQKLFKTIDRAINQKYDESAERPDQDAPEAFKNIIYQSKQISELLATVQKVAQGNMNVLITGESGTGKELVARAIHQLSKRNLNPFVPVNCGALPEHLFESELFGHERGAFTGAVKTKPGLLEFANQGTFFFDEIGEMSPELQVKLLRMLEERTIRRVGGQSEIDIDVRIIAATNKNLEREVAENRFREDFYYRLNTIHLHVPPLRERPEDILPLAEHHLKTLNSKNDKIVQGFTPEAEIALTSYQWSGNVRELQNMIERAYYLCPDRVIRKSDLPIPDNTEAVQLANSMLSLSYKKAKELVFEQFEINYLSHHLKKNEGNISRTAAECGLNRRTIHRLIKKYNIIYEA